MRREKENQDKRQHKCADRTLAVEEFEAEIGESEKPAEERHRAIEVVVRDGVQAAGAFQKRKIMYDKAERKKHGAEAADELFACVEEAKIEREAQRVGDFRQDECGVVHDDS